MSLPAIEFLLLFMSSCCRCNPLFYTRLLYLHPLSINIFLALYLSPCLLLPLSPSLSLSLSSLSLSLSLFSCYCNQITNWRISRASLFIAFNSIHFVFQSIHSDKVGLHDLPFSLLLSLPVGPFLFSPSKIPPQKPFFV